jgi:tetratricopeptide (TPR) repeat protein
MSVLDDIRSNAEAAHGTFDEATSLVKQAAEEADDLGSSAASHGWEGVAQAMSSAKEALEAADEAIDSAADSTSDGMRALGEITSTMSSDEVAGRLGEIRGGLDDARGAAAQALERVGEASSAASQADAESLLQTLTEAEGKLKEARESLQQAITDAESEQSEAASWGS